MKTNILQNIISRCHQRHKNPLSQRRTTIRPLHYKGLPYHFKVYCAFKYRVMLHELEAADISFMPMGEFPGNDRPPRSFDVERSLKRQEANDWEAFRWHRSWGILICTGIPSARNGAAWHDIDFKYEAICAAPDVVLTCIQALVDAVANPLLTMTISGGLRFSCRIPDYLHPNTKEERLYVHKHAPTAENPHQHTTYLEILGEKGYGRWDARHELLLGDLSDPPVISKDVLFPSISALRDALHEPIPQDLPPEEPIIEAPKYLGSGKLDLAKEAFFKRGFSYLKQEDECHYWSRRYSKVETQVSLWESEGKVWIRASTPDTGLPVQATLITDVWEDTGILPSIPETGKPMDEKVPPIRAGELSPLAIKRYRPVVHKAEHPIKIDETREEFSVLMQRALNSRISALRFIPNADSEKDSEVESILRNSGAICLNVSGDKLTKVNILEDHRVFLDPQHTKIAEQILEQRDETQQLCIINVTREDELYFQCELSKTTLENWIVNWKGHALGNFATALLNVTEIIDKSHDISIRRLRTVIQTYEWLEQELIRQMCHDVEDNQEAPTVCTDPNWTFWHQLKRFFAHYTSDANAPMLWEDKELRFWLPPMLHPNIKHLLVTSPTLNDDHLRRVFLDEETEIFPIQPMAWAPGTRVFQFRSDVYLRKTILDLYNTWDVFGVSETGQHIFSRIQNEIERDPNVKHGIITHVHTIRYLDHIAKNENVCFLTAFRHREGLDAAFQEAQIIWIVGMPEVGARAISDRSQKLFGNDEKPLSYLTEPKFYPYLDHRHYRYKDDRVQTVYEKEAIHIFTQVLQMAQINRLPNKTIMLITSLRIPEITDRPETTLFDWGDLDVAGEIDKLLDVIPTRIHFEQESEKLTVESTRIEVERVLGCSTRQAQRVMQKLRGGGLARVPFRKQIVEFLADGEKKTPEIVAAIKGHPKAINSELTRMAKAGTIVKVKRGLYRLPD